MRDEPFLWLDEQAVCYGVAEHAAQVKHGDVESIVQLPNLGRHIVVGDDAI